MLVIHLQTSLIKPVGDPLHEWARIVTEPTSICLNDFRNGDLIRIVPLRPPLFRAFVVRNRSKRLDYVQRLPVVDEKKVESNPDSAEQMPISYSNDTTL